MFAHGFGLTLLKAAPIHLPAVVGVRRCYNCPLGKRKKRRKGSIHPTGITQVSPHFIRKRKCDQMGRARVKFWKTCYKSVSNKISHFQISSSCVDNSYIPHVIMLKVWSSLFKNCRGCSQSPFTISLSTEHKLLALCVICEGSLGGKYPAETWWLLQWICKQQPQAVLHLVIASRCALNSNGCIKKKKKNLQRAVRLLRRTSFSLKFYYAQASEECWALLFSAHHSS